MSASDSLGELLANHLAPFLTRGHHKEALVGIAAVGGTAPGAGFETGSRQNRPLAKLAGDGPFGPSPRGLQTTPAEERR